MGKWNVYVKTAIALQILVVAVLIFKQTLVSHQAVDIPPDRLPPANG